MVVVSPAVQPIQLEGWQWIPPSHGVEDGMSTASDGDKGEDGSCSAASEEEGGSFIVERQGSFTVEEEERERASSPASCPRSKLLNRLGVPANSQLQSDIPRKTHESLIIFDFDDTLFCTSHMFNGIRQPPEPADLGKLDLMVTRILKKAQTLGTTKIVTNAQGGWVQSTAKKYLPKVNLLLEAEKDRLEIISARDKFEHLHPNDPVTWKVEAFCAIKENSKIIANLTAIGDSKAEMVAIKEMAKLYHISFFKAIRMKENPSCTDMQKELRILDDKFETIINAAKHYDISLKEKPVRKS